MDCLITKLKGTCSDNSIPKFGILKLEVRERNNYTMGTPTKNQCCIRINVIENTVIKVVGDGGGISTIYTDVTTNPENLQQEINLEPGSFTEIYCKYGNYDLEIESSKIKGIATFYLTGQNLSSSDFCYVGINLSSNLANLETFQVNGCNIKGSIDNFKGNTVLKGTVTGYKTAQASNSDRHPDLSGDISSLGEATGITTLTLAGKYSGLGDISGLGTLTELTYLNVAMLCPTGDLKDFIAVQKQSGRISCTGGITTIRPFIRVKFYGAGTNNKTYCFVKWDDHKEWIEEKAKLGEAVTNIYAHGATQAEIEAWTQQGIVVNNVGTDS